MVTGLSMPGEQTRKQVKIWSLLGDESHSVFFQILLRKHKIFSILLAR